MQTLWNRAELKSRGKEAFKKNYWSAVLVSLILVIVMGGMASGSSVRISGDETTIHYHQASRGFSQSLDQVINSRWAGVILAGILGVGLIFGILALVFKFMLGNMLEVGARSFYIENLYSTPSIGKIGFAFRSGNYWNLVKTMFFRDLFVFLWSLLFVIPGIIKSYEYRMVPYLIAEYPAMSRQEAFARSKEMMYGQKWNTFVLDLSFILWYILSGITCGIVAVFYVNPYVDATKAELYDVLAGNMQNQ